MKLGTLLQSLWLLGKAKMTRGVLSHRANFLQLSGLACITCAGFVIALWLGLLVAGVLLCVIGWAVDNSLAVDKT
jgi:hypothetical protein